MRGEDVAACTICRGELQGDRRRWISVRNHGVSRTPVNVAIDRDVQQNICEDNTTILHGGQGSVIGYHQRESEIRGQRQDHKGRRQSSEDPLSPRSVNDNESVVERVFSGGVVYGRRPF